MSPDKTTDSILAVVKDYIAAEVLNGDEVALDESTELIEQGILDSINLLRVITFLEERFGIQLADEDVVPQNFHSLRAIEKVVARYRSHQVSDNASLAGRPADPRRV